MRKAQIQLTFNWIYIAIAGAVILLFFFSIIVKQKQVSEERLSIEVVGIMESILAGAGVSEKTKNFIDASGLADYVLYFDCDEGVGEFGIQGRPARAQNSIDPVFAPREINSPRIIIWSLPYKLPFKVIDFLMVTSENTKYYILGNDDQFVNEFLNSTEGFNREYILNLNEIDVDTNVNVRIIDLGGTHIAAGMPASLLEFEDKKVSAVVFSANFVDYYNKDGNSWKKQNKDRINVISLGGDRDAAKYAAIFAGDDKVYQCNMNKAYERLGILTEVYGGKGIGNFKAGGKLGTIVNHYNSRLDLSLSTECLGHLQSYQDENILDELASLKNKISACKLQHSSCVDLISTAGNIKNLNDKLRVNCITLY
jgi:hypothetical protein